VWIVRPMGHTQVCGWVHKLSAEGGERGTTACGRCKVVLQIVQNNDGRAHSLVFLLGGHIGYDGLGQEVGELLHWRLDELGFAPELGRQEPVRRLQGGESCLHQISCCSPVACTTSQEVLLNDSTMDGAEREFYCQRRQFVVDTLQPPLADWQGPPRIIFRIC